MLIPTTLRTDEDTCLSSGQPHIVIGVTSPQTCVLLHARVKALRAAGLRVSVLSAPGEFLKDVGRKEQVEVFAVPMRRGISLFRDLISFARLCRLTQRLKPDIAEFSTPKAGFLGMLAARFCGVPVRIYFLRGLKLETSHGFRRHLLGWAERITAASAHRVICNSRSLRERALAMGIGPASKLILLGEGSTNGVNIERFAPGASDVREQFGIPLDAPVIGFSGRLTADKGLPELLEAFAAVLRRLPNAYLLLVGWFDAAEDALNRGIRSRIEGHPQIICTGFVEDAAPFYRAMDVMVLPSWREGFPNAVLEAAATGVPVVATQCTGSCDAVIPGVSGLLVPVGDHNAIYNSVLNLLCNFERRMRMSAAARAWVAENYEDRKVLGLAVAFYISLLKPDAQQTSYLDSGLNEAVTGLPASS